MRNTELQKYKNTEIQPNIQVKEVEGAKGSAWFTDTQHNVFLDSGDNSFPAEHVRNRFLFCTK